MEKEGNKGQYGKKNTPREAKPGKERDLCKKARKE